MWARPAELVRTDEPTAAIVEELASLDEVDPCLLREGLLLQWQAHPAFPASARTPVLVGLVEASAATPTEETWQSLELLQGKLLGALYKRDGLAETLWIVLHMVPGRAAAARPWWRACRLLCGSGPKEMLRVENSACSWPLWREANFPSPTSRG